MKIELHKIKVKDLFQGFSNLGEENGVWAYNGKLNIRPPYQREFVYSKEQQIAVIVSILNQYPLNVLYWVENKEIVDGKESISYEVLDGQQRIMSICSYLSNSFDVKYLNFNSFYRNLVTDYKAIIDNYELQVYICKDANESDKLNWFKTINIAGEKLTTQELRNSAFKGKWLSDAKRYFSKTNCLAFNIGSNYLKGDPIRQEYLETVLKWIGDQYHIDIEDYMSKSQSNDNANELKQYFENVINWVKVIFPNYRKEMKGLEWGYMYNKYAHDKSLISKAQDNEQLIKKLYADDEITKKSGIFEYILSGDEKYLSFRKFNNNDILTKFEQQNHLCNNPKCQKLCELKDTQADHIIPWSKGGKTILANLQILCSECNRYKSNK